MNIYHSLSLEQSQPLPAKAQTAAADRPNAAQKAELTDDTATAVKQNFDVVTISEEGKAAVQALNVAPVEGSSSESLFLDAAGESSVPSHVVVVRDTTDYAARKRSDTYWALVESRNTVIEGLKDISFGSYSPTTGRYTINLSAADRFLKTKLWEWQEDLRVNDPEAYEIWVSEHGEMKEPRFPGSGEWDVYQVIDLTPDEDGNTELDRFHMVLQQMKDMAALIEEQYRKCEEEESGEPSAAERLETQNAKLENPLQTNDPEASEIRLEQSDGSGLRQHELQPN